jgi:flagellar basal body-associated protein FliL
VLLSSAAGFDLRALGDSSGMSLLMIILIVLVVLLLVGGIGGPRYYRGRRRL